VKTEDYIYTKIRSHFGDNYIWIHETDVEKIYNQIIHNGVYAFQIKYDDCEVYDTYIKEESYKFAASKPIDYRLIIPFSKKGSDIVSIDGGKRYQWNKREILVIDPIEIRELKLKEIGID